MRVKLEGWEQVSAALRELPRRVDEKVVKQTLRASARPVVMDARARTTSERVRKDLKVLNVETEVGGRTTARVGLPGGRGPKSFMGLFIEMGTGPRVQKTTGRRTGSLPARPFLRPAMDSQAEAVFGIFGEEIWKRIERYGGS